MKLRELILAALIISGLSISAQDQSIRFEHLTTKNGLSINRITSIYKDKLGYMWFGTYWGLNRFDGREFVTYFHDEESENISLHHNSISWIAEGPEDLIFIQTGEQISGYDVVQERFVDLSYVLNNIPVSSGQIKKVLKDSNGNLWMACSSFGVFKMNPAGDIIFLNSNDKTIYTNSPEAHDIRFDKDGNLMVLHSDGNVVIVDINSHGIIDQWQFYGVKPEGFSWEIFQDSKGGFWLYAQDLSDGVLYFKNRTSLPIKLNEKQLGSNLISEVIEDDIGNVIIATDHGGLSLFNLNNETISHNRHDPSNSSSLNHYGAISAFKDNQGTVWIGTNKGGISYYNPKSSFFSYYKYQSPDDKIYDDINAVVIEDEKNIWIGSDTGGLMQLDAKTNKFKVINRQSGNAINDLKSNTIVCFAKVKNGIWIGTYHGGLSFFDGKRFINYIDLEGIYDLPDNTVWSVFVDSKSNLWVGTQHQGVFVFDPNQNQIEKITTDNGLIESNYITSFDEDLNGNIWVGTGRGAYVYNPSTRGVKKFLKNKENSNSIMNNSIENIHCNDRGEVWIGTKNGLSKYKVETGLFENYAEKDGLTSSYVLAIEEDGAGGLWLGTNRGLSLLTKDEENTVIRNFDESYGLQGELFNQHASFRSEDGLLAFAGSNGINLFRSKDIQPVLAKNGVVFRDLQIANEKVISGKSYSGRVLLSDGLNRTEKIELKHFENSFSIGYAALNYSRPSKVLYRYKLAGFDENWVTVGDDQRRANYTNMDPGQYTFMVQSTNDLNAWDGEISSIDIFIATPFWKLPIAYLGYFVMVLLIIYLILKVRIDRERLKTEMENEKIEANRLHELNLMKIRFFTNIGHEFRTPLTLILTPIERVIKNVKDSSYTNEYMVIQKNAKRLLTLVNQLLDFRKMEVGQHQLSLSGGDLIKFLKDIIESFSDLSKENNIEVKFETDYKELITQFDRDKMEKVMFNLFSNAFKFTSPEGKIVLSVKSISRDGDSHQVAISISDTGIGIPKENLKHVFTRFYQSDLPSNMMNHGSGIGLSITKEFAELHNGTIDVYSEVGKGTTFVIKLPFTQSKAFEGLREEDGLDLSISENGKTDIQKLKKYTIILVEDNEDFRFYLKDNLKEFFNIIEAENGEVGYDKILEMQPDLIVSDVMMPVLNGLDMTTKLKKERKTKHIPIILLSSHQSDKQKIEGLKAGAVDFISKPFNFEILENRIKSALILKENIKDSEKKIAVSPSEIEITSLDEQLIQKALAIVEENISNAEFSVQELSRELGVSRAQLYKKVVSITGQSPIEFIRDIRLKRAALLLEKSQLSVSEIAYKVGFNNPRYFSNYFKTAYKVLPSKYVETRKLEINER